MHVVANGRHWRRSQPRESRQLKLESHRIPTLKALERKEAEREDSGFASNIFELTLLEITTLSVSLTKNSENF